MKRPRPKANKKFAPRRSARMAKKMKVMEPDETPSRQPGTGSCEDQQMALSGSNDSPQTPSVSEDDPPCPGSSVSALDPTPSTSRQAQQDDHGVWMDQSSEEDDPPRAKSKVKLFIENINI